MHFYECTSIRVQTDVELWVIQCMIPDSFYTSWFTAMETITPKLSGLKTTNVHYLTLSVIRNSKIV